MKSLIVLTSVTSAKRVERVSMEHGIRCTTVHTPKSLTRYGCSHSVKCPSEDLSTVYLISKKMGMKIYGIYNEKTVNGRTVYEKVGDYDIS